MLGEHTFNAESIVSSSINILLILPFVKRSIRYMNVGLLLTFSYLPFDELSVTASTCTSSFGLCYGLFH